MKNSIKRLRKGTREAIKSFNPFRESLLNSFDKFAEAAQKVAKDPAISNKDRKILTKITHPKNEII